MNEEIPIVPAKYEYIVQTFYPVYGWEDVFIGATTAEARARLKEYRTNQPLYTHRVIRRKTEEYLIEDKS